MHKINKLLTLLEVTLGYTINMDIAEMVKEGLKCIRFKDGHISTHSGKQKTDQNPITHTYVILFIPRPEKDNNKKPRFIKTLQILFLCTLLDQ